MSEALLAATSQPAPAPGCRRRRLLRWWAPLALMALGGGLAWWERPPTVPYLAPVGVVLDARGVIYVADSGNRCIWRLEGRRLTRFAGKEWPWPKTRSGFGVPPGWPEKLREMAAQGDGILARDAYLMYPRDLAIDHRGDLYVAEVLAHGVRKIDERTGLISTVWRDLPDGIASRLPLPPAEPSGAAVGDRRDVYVSTRGGGRIWRVDAQGRMSVAAGIGRMGYSGDGGPATQAMIGDRGGLAIDAGGNLLIADTFSASVRRVDRRGIITTVVRTGKPPASGTLARGWGAPRDAPYRIATDAAGNVYIGGIGRIWKLDPAGKLTVLRDLAGHRPGHRLRPGQAGVVTGLAAVPDGSLYFAGGTGVWRLGPSGGVTTVLGGG